MKKIFASAFILLLAAGAVNAQVISNPEGSKAEKHKIKEKEKHDFKKLNLTAEQKAKLKSIKEANKKQLDELKKQKLTHDEFQAKRKALQEQFRTQMQSVLTAEQKAQLAQSKTAWKEKHKDEAGKFKAKGKGQRDFAHNRGAELQKELNLSAEQKQKMQQLRADFKPKMEALRNDQSLTKEQKRVKMQELMKEQQQQMKSILTPEQLQKVQSMRKDHMNRDSK